MARLHALAGLLLASLDLAGGIATAAPCRPTHPVASCSRTVLMQTAIPGKFVTCGKCKATFEVNEADFESGGRQVQCGGTGCTYKWFQTADRLQTMPNDVELVEYPQEMKDRIAAGKPAEPVGRYRCFVGNLPFSASEEELREIFARFGSVVNVFIMKDDDGRPRGFGFVNMESTVAGAQAVAELNGYELQGRSITVSEAKQSKPSAPRTTHPSSRN